MLTEQNIIVFLFRVHINFTIRIQSYNSTLELTVFDTR